jgi:glycosyltransferase involved in cell wall biosynthesis
VQSLAAKYPEVKVLGFIEKPREMARVLASCDVVACLCPYETFGLAAVEAMASGAAVLGSGKMSIGELLRHTRGGIALDDTTADTVAGGWLELLRPGRAALLGARGRAEVEKRWSWKATFRHIVDVYLSVVQPASEEPARRVASLVEGDQIGTIECESEIDRSTAGGSTLKWSS